MSTHPGIKQPSTYEDGRTKQSFAASLDRGAIIRRAQATGSLSHLAQYGREYAVYGHWENIDMLTAMDRVQRGTEIFQALPSELRKEFNQNPAEFFSFVNDPANAERLPEIFPQLAEPGPWLGPEPQEPEPPVAASQPAAEPPAAEER